jgi:hypothetical protein
MVLISEAANWDYFAGMAALTDPFDHCENVPTGYYPETPEYAGPTTTTQPIDGNSGMGNCHYPQGRSTYVAADGSARSGDFGGDIMKVVTLSDGTYAFKRFWAPGQ